MCVKKAEEELNANGHQLDIARINLYVGQLQHQTALEDAGNILRRYEAKIKAGKESYVRRKAHIEGNIERFCLQYKQLEARTQNIVNIRENLMTDLKSLVKTHKIIVAMSKKILRNSKRIAHHFKTMKAKKKKSSRGS